VRITRAATTWPQAGTQLLSSRAMLHALRAPRSAPDHLSSIAVSRE